MGSVVGGSCHEGSAERDERGAGDGGEHHVGRRDGEWREGLYVPQDVPDGEYMLVCMLIRLIYGLLWELWERRRGWEWDGHIRKTIHREAVSLQIGLAVAL